MKKKEGFSILLVEDNKELSATISDYLEASGYLLDFALDGLTALHLVATVEYDLILLDVMLPGVEGLEVCQRLRSDANKDTPVIIMSARDALEDKLNGFDAGADDYLVKPFELKELEARILAHMRRRRGEVVKQVYQVEDLTLNTSTMSVERAGQSVKLSPTCVKILRILMRESPSTVPKTEIERELWGEDPPDSDALRSHIYKLRKAVDGPFDQALIQTIQGMGLRLALEKN